MDYSQFLFMKQEIGLLIVFLAVFLYDTFMPRKALPALPAVSAGLMLILTLLGLPAAWEAAMRQKPHSQVCTKPRP